MRDNRFRRLQGKCLGELPCERCGQTGAALVVGPTPFTHPPFGGSNNEIEVRRVLDAKQTPSSGDQPASGRTRAAVLRTVSGARADELARLFSE